MALFHGWLSTALSQGKNEKHFEAVYFFPLSSQKLLVLIFYQPLTEGQTTQTEI